MSEIRLNNSRKSREIGMLKAVIKKKDAKIERLEARVRYLEKQLKQGDEER